MITLKVLCIAYLPRTCRVLSETAVKYFWTFKFLRVKNPSVLLSSLVQSCSSLPSSKFCSSKSGSFVTAKTIKFELFLIKMYSFLNSTSNSSLGVHEFALFFNILPSNFQSCDEPGKRVRV